MRNTRVLRAWSACVLLALGLATDAHAEDIQIIVNNSNPASTLSAEYVSKAFRGKVTQWDHGGKIQPVDRSGRSAVRASFSEDVVGKSVSAVKAHWQRMVFSGRGVPPPELGSDAEVMAFVERHPGGIGYVTAGTALKGVKAVEVRR